MSKKEKENPNHHMGKQTGYELTDGKYHIAPLYREQFDVLAARRQAIDDLVKMVNKHATQDLEELNKESLRLWDDLFNDLPLERGKAWAYRSGVVSQTPPEEVKE